MRERTFKIALGISTLFHLSMITLFSIVVRFPISPATYYEFEWRKESPATLAAADTALAEEPAATGSLDALRVPTSDSLFQVNANSTAPALDLETPVNLASLPGIELPTLEFAELERVQLQQRGSEIQTRLLELNRQGSGSDSWERFGEGLDRLRDTLVHLPWLEDDAAVEDDAGSHLQRVSTHAAGFAVYVEWMTPPLDRELIFSPPIDALWSVERLDEPIMLIFRVNAQGQVVEVNSPVEDEAGLVVSAARALFNYRFEPLTTDVTEDQRGTLLIEAEGSAP